MEGRNTGLRSIFIIFWIIGSIFWIMIGALDGNFLQSVIAISIGWGLLFLYFWVKDEYMRLAASLLLDDDPILTESLKDREIFDLLGFD